MGGGDYEFGKAIIVALNIGTIDPAGAYLVPLNRVLIAVQSSDGDIVDMRLQFRAGAATWRDVRNPDSVVWDPVQDDWNAVMIRARSDGERIRLENSGVNAIDNVWVMLE